MSKVSKNIDLFYITNELNDLTDTIKEVNPSSRISKIVGEQGIKVRENDLKLMKVVKEDIETM